MKKKYLIEIAIIIALICVLGLILIIGYNTNNSGNSATTEALNSKAITAETSSNTNSSTEVISVSGAIYSSSDLFTSRDLEQTADLTDAIYYTVSDGNDIHITKEGVYVISGTANNVTIYVEAGSEDKVQIVLNGVSITNTNMPCIYVKTADKVFVTTSIDSTLIVSGSFAADGDTNLDGVIFSKSDITLNGVGTLTIKSTDNGIVGKDDVKVTGGTYYITASSKAIEANDSIRIADGVFALKCGTDGLHAENEEDDTLGYIYIGDGEFTIEAGDDGIHANSVIQIDNGTMTINAVEGIEATYIQINGGTISISATDDGINAANKSSSYNVVVEINGGNIKVVMGQGDTDGVDSNGDIYINGGTIDVTGNSSFDYDGNAKLNGGTVIVNGTQVNSIPNQFMGGQGGPGSQGGFGGPGGKMF